MKVGLSDADFMRLYTEIGATGIAKRFGLDIRNIRKRRKRLEIKHGVTLKSPYGPERENLPPPAHRPERVQLDVANGIVLVGSDLHIWPGEPSLMVRVFINFCRQLKPAAVILNGDVMDFPNISQHPPIGWENLPTVQAQIEAAQNQLHEIATAAGKAEKIWTAGNHDLRFEKRIAQVAPEYAKVAGVHLKDHFPLWQPCWSVWINNNTVVKHRFKGGRHAASNNALWAGMNIITGHLHAATVESITDLRGTRHGCDTGCMADPFGPQFNWMEDNPRNWRQAFAVLTFFNRQLLIPELALALDDNLVQFRGSLIRV